MNCIICNKEIIKNTYFGDDYYICYCGDLYFTNKRYSKIERDEKIIEEYIYLSINSLFFTFYFDGKHTYINYYNQSYHFNDKLNLEEIKKYIDRFKLYVMLI